MGRTEDWLSKIERGERDIRRLDVLADLARALRVTLGDLLGEHVLMEEQDKHDDVPAIRDALMAPSRLSGTLFSSSMSPEYIDPQPVRQLVEVPGRATRKATSEGCHGATRADQDHPGDGGGPRRILKHGVGAGALIQVKWLRDDGRFASSARRLVVVRRRVPALLSWPVPGSDAVDRPGAKEAPE
ncbi:helix-turn-helix domain-containing protein [Amycolatopsis japonica]|uniref:helix-turn-helix domain-containing protein n=1 Tax=Amycolatopsis japonica TaxID=208439 RepID=UPI003829AC89